MATPKAVQLGQGVKVARSAEQRRIARSAVLDRVSLLPATCSWNRLAGRSLQFASHGPERSWTAPLTLT